MMKKILSKLLVISLILISLLSINTQVVYASSISEIIGGADDFIQAGVDYGDADHPTLDDESMQEMSDLIYNVLLVIAIIIAVIFGLVIAIQFMTGSIEQKAKVKETLVPYIAGCVVIFGAFTIWKLVVTLLSQA